MNIYYNKICKMIIIITTNEPNVENYGNKYFLKVKTDLMNFAKLYSKNDYKINNSQKYEKDKIHFNKILLIYI